MSAGRPAEWWRPRLASVGGPPAAAPPLKWEREDAGSVVPFWALMGFTFVLLLAPQTFVPALGPLRLGLLTAGVAIATFVCDRFLARRPIMRVTPEILAVGGLVFWALLTLPLSFWPGGSVAFLLDVFLKTLAIFWVLAHVAVTRARLRRVAWGLVLMSVPLSAFGIREYLAGRFIDDPGPVRRIASFEAPLTQNPNDLALMLNLILPLALALSLAQERLLPRLVLLGCGVVAAVGVVLTFSRAGFICLSTTCLLYLWKLIRRPGRLWAVAALLLALASAPLLPEGYVDRLSTIVDIGSDPTGSAQERRSDTLAALRFVSHHPIAGAGIGMNILALNEVRGAIWKKVHNVYLEYAVDLGLPGLALFLAVLAGSVRSCAQVMRETATAPWQADLFLLAEGIQVSLAVFAVAALFHPVAYHFYFYYIAGLALAARSACANQRFA